MDDATKKLAIEILHEYIRRGYPLHVSEPVSGKPSWGSYTVTYSFRDKKSEEPPSPKSRAKSSKA